MALKSRCVAWTIEQSPDDFDKDKAEPAKQGLHRYDFLRSIEWTADGTTVIATSAANDIHTCIVPPDLLEDNDGPHTLTSYSIVGSGEPVNAVTTYPLFDLQNPATTLILSSVRDHPIRLNSALVPDMVASYPLVNTKTEAVITPHSLLFRSDGTRFITGSDSLIAVFDVSRHGQEPILSLTTSSKRNNTSMNPGMHMKGIISALDVDENSGLLAAGTFTRYLGLYDDGGAGECVGVFTVEGTGADKHIGGRGITQVLWSPCGRYLYIAERKSNGALIYDIRQTGQLVSWLEGRRASTNQRLGVDLIATDTGQEFWAGGTDGLVRVWKNAHQQEGAVESVLQWPAHADVASGVAVHPSGAVIATSSGQRHPLQEDEEKFQSGYGSREVANLSLKLWAGA